MRGLVPFNNRRTSLAGRNDDFYSLMDDFWNDGLMRRAIRDTFKLDVRDAETEYVIEADLPGVKKEDVSLELNDGQLTISVVKQENADSEANGYIHRERRTSSMSRGVYLPEATAESIKAKLENGVLCITVPKQTKTEQSKKIEID